MTRCQVVVVEGGEGGKRRLRRSLVLCIFVFFLGMCASCLSVYVCVCVCEGEREGGGCLGVWMEKEIKRFFFVNGGHLGSFVCGGASVWLGFCGYV